MSDLAKKCAEAARREAEFSRAIGNGTPKADKRATRHERLAAFIEAAQELRDHDTSADIHWKDDPKDAYDAALRGLAQSMEVSDDCPREGSAGCDA